jgi:Acyl-CoA dehydrogenase, middle domain/Acyl-CoA dehydrogenase, N-terminal domain
MTVRGGFAGICFPREYGGLGPSYEYKKAFDAEALAYETLLLLNVPSFAICCATILDMGTEDQKRTHIPGGAARRRGARSAALRTQRGSDLAGVITHADRRDGRWIINGAKTWSSWAFAADYGLCLARTDWGAPKHNGLTMFLLPLRHAGVTINRIRQVNGSEYTSGPGIAEAEDVSIDVMSLVDSAKLGQSARVREMVGRVLVRRAVHGQLSERVYHAVVDGSLPPAAGSIFRLDMAEVHNVENDTAYAIAGSAGGTRYLGRQIASIGGGTTEMARNVTGERVLNFPREYAADRGVPFNQVRRGKAAKGDQQ